CSHRLALSFFPDAFISALNRSVTSGRHPPQPVPALVHFFTSSTEQRFMSRIEPQILLLLTLLHEHTCMSSSSAVTALGTPAGLPTRSSPGAIGSGLSLFASSDSWPYSEASPTRIPPSNRVPSRLNSSFLYVPLNGSS